MTAPRFEGRVAIVTGAAHGQGRAEAVALAAEGAHVVIADIDEDSSRREAEDIGPSASFCPLDVADEVQWAAAIDHAETHGPLSTLVNNAGIFRPAAIEATSTASFESHFRINQLGPFLGVRAAASAMRRAGGGSIVNISSVAGLRGGSGAVAYTSSKWALRGITRSAAAELGPSNIRVNSVHPSLIETGMTEFMSADVKRDYAAALPLGRLPSIDDVAGIVLYLLSDAAAAITGAEFKVDGGAIL